MAYTKIHAIKSTLVKALDYIEDPSKTEDQVLVSGYNVDPLSASMEFTMTRAMARNMLGEPRGKKGQEILAYHLIQSFSPEDAVTPEQAHELGRRLANELLGGKFEYVISTHVDKGHIHNHIIFNATSFYDLRKFRTQPYKTANKIRSISDRICAEADLSVIRTPEELGRSYRYTKRNTPSWKRQIRRRLQFVLQAAGSFEQFVDGAARLGVTVDASGKHVTYRMEGQQRVTRDRSLDKNGGYSLQGIQAQIEANTEVREQLKETIREAAAQSTDRKQFKAELHRRGVELKQTRSSGARYKVDGETTIAEWALGPAYSTEAIQEAFGRAEDAFTERSDVLDQIAERFRETGRDTAQEVPVPVSRAQVLKTTAEGILVSVPDERRGVERMAFIGHDHTVYHRDTDSFTAYIGNGYDYYVATADGERTGSKVRGEDIIRALELAGGVQPTWIEFGAGDVRSVSPKGLMVCVPELGIGKLFLEDRFVAYERAEGGSARAAVYGDWSYRFEAVDGSTRYVSGNDLIGRMETRQALRSGSLVGRIDAMRRRNMVTETKQLAQALLLVRREGIEDLEGFTSRLDDLREKQASVQASIQALRERRAAYQTVAKQLVTYHTYLPVKLASMELTGKARRSYEQSHEAELSAWKFAEQQLERSGVQPEVDPDKVLGLVGEQTREIEQMEAQAKELAKRAEGLEAARSELQRVQEEAVGQGHEKNHRDQGER